MSGTLPLIYGCEAQYPVVVTISTLTDVITSRSGAEIRRMVRPPLLHIDLTYSKVDYTNTFTSGQFKDFFVAQLGKFGSGISLSLFGNTYHNLYLTEDQILFTRDVLSYSFPLSLMQSQPLTTSYGTPITNYDPSYVQDPFALGYMYRTYEVVQPSGVRYARAAYGGGYRNHPANGYGIWKFQFPQITTADAAQLQADFLAQRGRLMTFSMRDPMTIGSSASFIPNCRFDMDDLVLKYNSDGSVSTSSSIRTVTA